MAQMQPEKDPEERRTIAYSSAGIDPVIFETITKKKSDWGWQNIAGFKKHVKNGLVWVQSKLGELKVNTSGNVSAEIVNQAILKHFGVDPAAVDPDIWKELPKAVVELIRKKLKANCDEVSEVFYDYSEPGLSGKIFHGTVKPVTSGKWNVNFKSLEFSNIAKEPSTGTDLAVILIMTDDKGKQAVKTLWFQAKKAPTVDTRPDELQDLPEQLAIMRKHTKESFSLIYAPDGVVVGDALDKPGEVTLPKFIADALRCEHGDPSLDLFADSVHRKQLFNIEIAAKPPKPKTTKAKSTD